MTRNIFTEDYALAVGLGLRFFFKGEDFDEQGAPVGPVYALFHEGQKIRSKRYVTWAEAKQVAQQFNAELDEM